MRRSPRQTSRAPGSSRRSAKRIGSGPAIGPAQQRAQARLQLAQGERLDEVVVGAGVEALDAIVDRVARGEHQHGRPVTGLPQAPADLEPVEPRHRDVEDDRFGGRGGQPIEGFLAVGGEVDVVPVKRERTLQCCANGRLVVDNQDLHFLRIVPRVGFPVCRVGDGRGQR